MDAGLHEGYKMAGIDTYIKFMVEQECKYVDSLLSNQPELLRDDSIVIESGVEHVEFRKPPKVEVLVAGIPCTGASKAGRTKNKIAAAEMHESAGACFIYLLSFIAQCQPVQVIVENVVEYISTTSMAVMTSVLKTWGYDIQIDVKDGVKFGALEQRKRMVMVASTRGLNGFELDKVKPVKTKPETLSEVLEDIPLDSKAWKDYNYLEVKAKRDKADGKGFKRALMTGEEETVFTIRRLYHKAGSTDPFVLHPDGKKSRLFTPTEHAKIKGIPVRLIKGLSSTVAHEVMGQSVIFPVFKALGAALGEHQGNSGGI